MNEPYNLLERSLLGDHTGLIASNNETLSAAERHPYIYTTCLIMAALFGYAFLFIFPLTVLALAISVPGAIIEAKDQLDVVLVLSAIAIAAGAGWMSWYLYRVKPALPAGRPLKTDEAPMLFEAIQESCRQLGAPQVHMVRLVRDYHIEIVKTPSNGYPLSCTNTLLIGLPMFQSLSPGQLMLAINRELAHLASPYKRSTAWAYFISKIWCQYRILHHTGWHPASIIMRVFFSCYAPLFKLLAQSAIREEEFYADQTINNADRNFTFIDMLSTQSIHRRYLDEHFWPHLLNNAYKYKTPPYLPYASMQDHLHSKLDSQSAQALLDTAMSEKPKNNGSMPVLKQRLFRLGLHTVMLPEPEKQSATQYFSDHALVLIIGQMDHIWLKTSQFDWQQKFRTGQLEQNKLKELRVQSRQRLLTNHRTWEYIQLIKKYVDDEQALELYKQVLSIDTDDARIGFDIGQTLLAHMDRQGIEALENAIAKDPGYTVMACQLITDFFVRCGDSRSAQTYRRKALAYQVEAA